MKIRFSSSKIVIRINEADLKMLASKKNLILHSNLGHQTICFELRIDKQDSKQKIIAEDKTSVFLISPNELNILESTYQPLAREVKIGKKIVNQVVIEKDFRSRIKSH